MNDETCLEARDVYFTYGEGTEALRGVTFSVKQGEFVAVLGSNGSGKTTLIKLLVGLLKPRRGRILLNGTDVGALPPRDLYQQVGLVLQNPNDQLFAATVGEDVAFGPRNLDLPEPEVEDRVTDALRSVSALELRDRAIHHLSYGEQKRASLAGVLAMRPSVLIMDEPTAGLDPAGETLMMHLLNRLNREQGITVVLATHSVDMLPLFADRITVLDRGTVLTDGTADDIFCNQEMIDRASLRIPYVSSLLYEMKRYDGVPIEGLPLTIGEARKQLLALIPADAVPNGRKRGPS
jgi:cobalt/nickel transport system ATP-binding protein